MEDIASKAEGWAYGVADRPVAVEEVVEEGPVDEVSLGANRKMRGKVPVDAAAEAVKALPVDLFAGGRQFM